MEIKVKCSRCPETRVGKFYTNRTRPNGISTICKACQKAYQKTYKKLHPVTPEQRRKYALKYRKTHKKQVQISRRRYNEKWLRQELGNGLTLGHTYSLSKIGLTPEQYLAKLTEQGDCCGICGRHKSVFKKALHADHDHITREFRGCLCESCNRALGFFMDDVEVVKKAVVYLSKTGTSLSGDVLENDPPK
jgi:hypothetical protein